MKINKQVLLKLITLLFSIHFCSYGFADTTIKDLLDDEKLRVELFLSVEGQKNRSSKLARPAAVHEQIDLIVKVSSDRWFTRGTRIMPLSLNGALVQQRDKLASNYTQRIDGQTWSVQEWQLAIYPVEAGTFTIPYLTLSASVSLEEGGSAQGYLQTPSVAFDVVAPVAEHVVDSFAATQVRLTQKWSEAGEAKVGDAIERSISIAADETTISLLPAFELAELGGTKGYSEVILAQDKQQRGRYSAHKKLTHTYLVQESGQLLIPEIVMNWWNTEAGKMEQITLPALEVNITHTPKSWLTQFWLHLVIGFALLAMLVMMLGRLHLRYQEERLPRGVFFVRQLVAKNWRQAHRHLYNQHRHKNASLVLRGKVAKAPLDEWSRQHFATPKQNKKPRAMTLIKIWLRIAR